MTTSAPDHDADNVIDFFTGKPYSELANLRLIRLAPEHDGLEMLYSNDAHPDKLFSIRILFWGLRANGDVVGLVPWLNTLMACDDIRDPQNGRFEGYYDGGIDELFFEPPLHKVIELESSAQYYECECDEEDTPIQELPDTIGTHAVLSGDGFQTITLKEVVSWRLHYDGTVSGMLVDEDKVLSTPVLPGDECLFPSDSHDHFKYYFQHHIANKLKAQDPEAMAAIATLMES